MLLKHSCPCSHVFHPQLIIFSVNFSFCCTDENRTLDEANKRLVSLLEEEQKHRSKGSTPQSFLGSVEEGPLFLP